MQQIKSMKNKIVLVTAALVLSLGIVVNLEQAAAADISVGPSDSIQDAIDSAASGDTIIIAAGTYKERLVIDKPLIIVGAQAGVDARGRSGAETIIESPTSATPSNFIVRVESSDVTLDGLNLITEAPTDAYHGIQVQAGVTAQNLRVENTIVQGTSGGFFAYSNASLTGLHINQSVFKDNNRTDTSSSIYLANATGDNIEISDNIIQGNDNGNAGSKAGINVGSSTTALTNVRILRNQASNTGSFLVYHGITEGEISGNTATGNANASSGIFVGLGVNDVVISGNTLTDYNNGINFSTAFPASADPSTNISIEGNAINDMRTTGILVTDGAYAGDMTVQNNSLVGNAAGINNQSSEANILADLNWWGCPEGPGADGCDSIAGTVVASVWYTDAALTTTNEASSSDAVAAGDLANTGSNIFIAIGAALAALALTPAILALRRRKKAF